MVRMPAIVGAALCFLVLVVLQIAGVSDTSAPKMGAGVLFWIFAWWALLPLLLRGWRHGLSKRANRRSLRGGSRLPAHAPMPPLAGAWPPPDAQSPPARSLQPSPGTGRTAPPATRGRCVWHHNKVVFETETEAQEFVQWTRRRHAAGRWNGKPMDHCYQCPVLWHRHWHVSSKPRHPW